MYKVINKIVLIFPAGVSSYGHAKSEVYFTGGNQIISSAMELDPE